MVEFELLTYDRVVALLGLLALGAAILPKVLAERAVSFPLLYVGFGILVFALPLGLEPPHPLEHGFAAEHLTELGVIVALMGLGLKIDRELTWVSWSITWRLLAVTMIATIVLVGLLGWGALGFAPATAMLLGACIAPTDPVLAADVQAEQPQGEAEGPVRFALSSEAGLNDSLAFPFTNAAILAAIAGAAPGGWIGEWLVVDVLYRIGVGVAGGLVFGWVVSQLVFSLPLGDSRLARSAEGVVALGATLLTYGATELAEGYGFLAVFICARTIRSRERDHEYHQVLHDFADQAERVVMAVILVLFGGALVAGLLAPLTWQIAVVAVVIVLVVRPLAGVAGLLGHDEVSWTTRGVVAFFGIRGIGSLYYLSHGLEEAEFSQAEELWALVGLVVLVSIVVHGLSTTPVMRRYEHAVDQDAEVAADATSL